MISCLYEGVVSHSRSAPARHSFQYSIFMFCLDLDHLPESRLFGTDTWKPFRFVASDYQVLSNPDTSNSPRQNFDWFVKAQDLPRPTRIFFCGNVRTLGYSFNPVCFFYCLDANGKLMFVVAEVTNTFGEKKIYTIESQDPETTRIRKDLYVSPFIHHGADFLFRFKLPGKQLRVKIHSITNETTLLRAGIQAKQRALNDLTLALFLVRYPFATVAIIFRIHFQALMLWLKRIPHFSKATSDRELEKAGLVR